MLPFDNHHLPSATRPRSITNTVIDLGADFHKISFSTFPEGSIYYIRILRHAPTISDFYREPLLKRPPGTSSNIFTFCKLARALRTLRDWALWRVRRSVPCLRVDLRLGRSRPDHGAGIRYCWRGVIVHMVAMNATNTRSPSSSHYARRAFSDSPLMSY